MLYYCRICLKQVLEDRLEDLENALSYHRVASERLRAVERVLEDTERGKLCAEKELEELRKIHLSDEDTISRRRVRSSDIHWDFEGDEKISDRNRKVADRGVQYTIDSTLDSIEAIRDQIGEVELSEASDNDLISIQNDLEVLVARVRRTKEQRLRQRAEELEMKRKLEGAKEPATCCVCVEAPRTVLLLPCRHLCVCESCVSQPQLNNKCPVCRANISDTIKVFCS